MSGGESNGGKGGIVKQVVAGLISVAVLALVAGGGAFGGTLLDHEHRISAVESAVADIGKLEAKGERQIISVREDIRDIAAKSERRDERMFDLMLQLIDRVSALQAQIQDNHDRSQDK